MPTSFNCPMCAAPLELAGDDAVTMRCPYCGNTVMIPEEVRGGLGDESTGEVIGSAFAPVIDQTLKVAEVARLVRAGNKIAAIKLYRETFGVGLREAKEAVEKIGAGQPISFMHTERRTANVSPQQWKSAPLMQEQAMRQKKRGARFWLGVGIALIVAVIGLFLIFGGVAAWLITARRAPTTGPASRPASSNGFASVALEFGSEGIGAGQFKDVRSVAVDGAGHVYVGEYMGGRVQVFDPQGKFITQWMVDQKKPLLGMAADRKGTVYVVQSSSIFHYEGASGQFLGEVTKRNPDRSESYADVFAALDGSLYAIGSNSKIVRMDTNGAIKMTINVAEKIGEDIRLDRLAVDGKGYVYALNGGEKSVFKFAPDGRFVNRFGGSGAQPGQFNSPSGIALDGQGRVYVSDLGHPIQVFDGNGRYLDSFGANEVVFGLAVNDQNEIFASQRNRHKIVSLANRNAKYTTSQDVPTITSAILTTLDQALTGIMSP
jgi:streptogramin lyase